MLLPTPPKETITPRRNNLIADMEDFQQVQFSFFEKMKDNLDAESENTETVEIEGLIKSQIEAYEKMWTFIDKL